MLHLPSPHPPAHKTLKTYALDCAQMPHGFDGVLDTIFINTKTGWVTVRDGITGKEKNVQDVWSLEIDVNGDRQADAVLNDPSRGADFRLQLSMSIEAYTAKLKPGQVVGTVAKPAAYGGGGGDSTTVLDIDQTGDGVADLRVEHHPGLDVLLVNVLESAPKPKPIIAPAPVSAPAQNIPRA